MKDLQLVNFYGDKIYLVEFEGEPYVPLKPIIENLGLVWAGQVQKILNDTSRWQVKTIKVKAQDGKPREMLCLPLRKLPAWLMSISPSKVKPKIREKLLRYQEECDKVLWDYWFKGRAENPRKVFSIPEDEKYRLPDALGMKIEKKEFWIFPLEEFARILRLPPEEILTYLDETKKHYLKLPNYRYFSCKNRKSESTLFITDSGIRYLFFKYRESFTEKLIETARVMERCKVSLASVLKLIKARKEGFTQKETGRALGISRSKVSYIERKLKEISFWSLI